MSDQEGLLLHVCVAPDDEAWVKGYLLPSLGLTKAQVHTRDDDRQGHLRVNEIAEATTRARYTLLVLSQAFLADNLSDYAASLATHLAVREQRLLLVSREACKLPLVLDCRVRVECHEGAPTDEWGAAMAKLRAVLEQPEPLDEELPCPYPGLQAYTAKEAKQFYGRDKEASRLLQRLRAGEREIYVLGPSGSGKSSLVLAGVLPKVEGRAALPFFDAPFVVRTMRPTGRPTDRLMQALKAGPYRSRHNLGVEAAPAPASLRGTDAAPASLRSAQAAPPSRGGVEATPPGSQRFFDPGAIGPAIAALLANAPAAGRVLLFIDQLEELFTQADLAERRLFFEALRALRAQPRCSMVLAMRVDFSGALMDSDIWPDLEDRFDPVRVAPLRGQALADAIEAPAHALGVAFEPRLAERLVADAADEPGALPLLQEALRLLWLGRERRLLRLRAYEALSEGGKSGLAAALGLRANAALDTLSPPERRVARRMFLRLVSFGEGRPNTRRQQTKAALLALGDTEAQAARVLDALTTVRLLTTGEDDRDDAASDDARIDLAHEALIEGWQALAEWIKALQGAEQTRRRLEAKIDEWRGRGRGHGGLLDAEELPEFDAWLKSDVAGELGIDRDMAALVERSRAALTWRKRWRNVAIALLATLLAVSSGLAFGFNRQRVRAEETLRAAVAVANDITFTIERELKPIAGASAARARLLQRSHDLLEKLKERAGEHETAGRVRAVTFQQQADLLLEQGKLPEADALYRQAHAYFAQQAERGPGNAELQRNLSVSHNKRGDVLATGGKLDEARDAFSQGLAIAQKLAAQDPVNAEWQRDLSVSNERLGDVLATAGKLDEARGAFAQSLAIRQTLAAQDPANAQWQRDLSVSHGKLGGVLTTGGKLDEARGAFQAALAIGQKLAALDPVNAEWQRDLSISHNKLGDVLATAGELDEARDAFAQGLAIRQTLAAQDPANAQWRKDLVVSHARLADVNVSLRRREEAGAHHREALRLMAALERDGLLREDAQMPQIRTVLAAIQQRGRL